MRKTPTVLLAAATIAVSLATFATDASAQRRGGAVAAGVAAGLVGGLIVGSAIANSGPAYGGPAYVVAPGPGYLAYPGYYASLPGPRCYWTRMPVYDRFGNAIGWRGRPVAVCP